MAFHTGAEAAMREHYEPPLVAADSPHQFT
jgi:hypothetical protein